MKTTKVILLILIIFINGCNKEEGDNPFPRNTEIGANTFMFRINGGKIINSLVGYLPTSPRVHVFYNHLDTFFNNNFIFAIEGNRIYLNDNKYIGINIYCMPSVGSYRLSEYVSAGKGNYAYYYDLNPEELYYYTDTGNTGELNITKLDTINHIISGNFIFKAKRWCLNGNCDEVITVDGQFDVKYKPNEGVNYY